MGQKRGKRAFRRSSGACEERGSRRSMLTPRRERGTIRQEGTYAGCTVCPYARAGLEIGIRYALEFQA